MIDLTPDQFRTLGYRAIDMIADQMAALQAEHSHGSQVNLGDHTGPVQRHVAHGREVVEIGAAPGVNGLPSGGGGEAAASLRRATTLCA